MPTKIHVLTVKLTTHVPIDPTNSKSREAAGLAVENLIGYAGRIGETVVETKLARIFAPDTAEDDHLGLEGADDDPEPPEPLPDDVAQELADEPPPEP